MIVLGSTRKTGQVKIYREKERIGKGRCYRKERVFYSPGGSLIVCAAMPFSPFNAFLIHEMPPRTRNEPSPDKSQNIFGRFFSGENPSHKLCISQV